MLIKEGTNGIREKLKIQWRIKGGSRNYPRGKKKGTNVKIDTICKETEVRMSMMPSGDCSVLLKKKPKGYIWGCKSQS